ncbi:autotransporter assembly complex family protein [Chitinimonas sp. BJYL2]|uniref:autotransporter assembly complex protein TamA n=1 Tax=Chitinimonas sp. BJYL2 TaxID=2976696 RepID=UPI0022B4503A|nr:autotransporter assembly complex family protein [Chitinimonas sp. BJYL2]
MLATLPIVLPKTSRLSLLIAALLSTPLLAAGLDYRVDIDAPGDFDTLLEDNLGIVRWQGSDYLDREQLDRLYAATPAEIQTLLAPQGYFRPKIESRMVTEGQGLRVRFKVIPGEQALIHDVDVRVEGPIRDEPDFQPRWAELLEVWPLPMGAYFTQPDWDAAKRRGLQAMVIDRFPAASIADSTARIDPDKDAAELSVVYHSGPRFTLGQTEINGLKQYPRVLVERLQTFAPGEPYSQQKLLDFQTALQNTPYFSNVFLDVPIDPAKPDNVPVRVELTEAPRYKTEAGIGYDTDKGPRTSLALRDNNLRGRGWIGDVGVKLQQREQTFNAGVQLPPDDDAYRYGASFKLNREDVSGLITTTRTLGTQRSRLKGRIEVTQALQYTLSNEYIQGLPAERNAALVLSQSWTRNALDVPNDPRRGMLLSWQFGGAAKALLSDSNFVRAWGRAAWYTPLGEAGLVLLRGEAGQVLTDSTASIPTDWLFRAGGSGSVRGYAYQSLGPRDEGSGAVLGGRVLATGSAEYQHRIVGKWRGAVFADVGGAAYDWLQFKAVKGVGVGARWASPVGPVALDLGYGLDERKLRFHFSLGAGF